MYDDKVYNEEKKKSVDEVVRNELEKKWFGKIVKKWWWNEMWMKEGLEKLIG
jgi:aminopeptidase N